MLKIYSNAQPGLLLHIAVTAQDFTSSRLDIVNPDEFIQMALIPLKEGQTFKPHQHVFKKGPANIISQESWVVLSGRVLVDYYDIDGKKLCMYEMPVGGLSITLRGGHNYTCKENGTKVLEIKTGPYLGQEHDKVFL